GREALAMAERLDLGELAAAALNNVGVARIHSGDNQGLADLERSIALATAAGAHGELCRSMYNFAACLWEQGELKRSYEVEQEGTTLATRIGHEWRVRFSRGSQGEYEFEFGRWNEALRHADKFIAEVESGSPHVLLF